MTMVRQHFKTLWTICLVIAGCVTIFGIQPLSMSHANAASATENWTVRCSKADAAKKTPQFCEVYQRLSVQKTGQRVAEFAVGYPTKDQAAARGVLILPLGILLTEDMHFKIDGQVPYAFRARYCTSDGCFAFLDLNKTLLAIMRDGKKLQITGKAFSGQDLSITLDLTGFDKALKKL